jgi:hypothetical protein
MYILRVIICIHIYPLIKRSNQAEKIMKEKSAPDCGYRNILGFGEFGQKNGTWIKTEHVRSLTGFERLAWAFSFEQTGGVVLGFCEIKSVGMKKCRVQGTRSWRRIKTVCKATKERDRANAEPAGGLCITWQGVHWLIASGYCGRKKRLKRLNPHTENIGLEGSSIFVTVFLLFFESGVLLRKGITWGRF